MAVTRERVEKLLGAVPGAQATVIRTYVSNSEELGGKRIIAQDVMVYRPTTAADVTSIKDRLVDIFDADIRSNAGDKWGQKPSW